MEVGTSTMSEANNTEHEHKRWEDYWVGGVNPGQLWDRMGSSPLLVKYVEKGDMIPDGRALVPGCGRGYDLVTLASPNRRVIGLDISESGVTVARDYLASLSDESFPNRENASVECRSFFDLNPTERPEDAFDFVYDYTFLCALDPSIRRDWAKKMAEIVKPGGILLTLIFPIWDKDLSVGPPFAVSLQLLEDLLVTEGFQCLELRLLESEMCHEDRDGGKDGNGPRSGVGRWQKL